MTLDAYVAGDRTPLSSVLVRDNQSVRAGDTIVRQRQPLAAAF